MGTIWWPFEKEYKAQKEVRWLRCRDLCDAFTAGDGWLEYVWPTIYGRSQEHGEGVGGDAERKK